MLRCLGKRLGRVVSQHASLEALTRTAVLRWGQRAFKDQAGAVSPLLVVRTQNSAKGANFGTQPQHSRAALPRNRSPMVTLSQWADTARRRTAAAAAAAVAATKTVSSDGVDEGSSDSRADHAAMPLFSWQMRRADTAAVTGLKAKVNTLKVSREKPGQEAAVVIAAGVGSPQDSVDLVTSGFDSIDTIGINYKYNSNV